MIRQRFTFTGSGEDFGPRADGLVTGHTTESPYNKLTVADAIVLARWQDRSDVLGSYNDLICIDGILECVPPSHASGGINPASTDFAPDAWLWDALPAEAVRNPNYFTRNVAFMGSKAWFDANGWPPEMIDNFVTVMLEEEARIGRKSILNQHEDFQNNRSDAGPIADALIKKRYLERTLEGEMYEWAADMRPTEPFRAVMAKGSYVRTAPELGPDSFDHEMTVDTPIIVIGSARGDAFLGSRTWYVYAGAEGLRVVHSRNQVGDRQPLTTTVIKEVPTGITQADADAQVKAAVAAFNKNLDTWAAARPRA